MKRYEFFCPLDGGGPADPEEADDGGYVSYQDAMAAVAAESERWRAIAKSHLDMATAMGAKEKARTAASILADGIDA